jgi:predicted protein tyrosine phosphatase
MPFIHVCSLEKLHRTVRDTGARDVLTVIKNVDQVERPREVEPQRHLKLDFADIWQPKPGEVMANAGHIRSMLTFIRQWERSRPMVIHCYAGVSRSTASAFLAACALRPDIEEREWARRIRASSPTATPNIHIVQLADEALGRAGRMVRAIEAIGRGEDCYEGVPFSLEIGAKRGEVGE